MLVCTDQDLSVWEHASILRAFQLWQFTADETTPGDELTFFHNESMTRVDYDGNVLAVTFTHHDLKDVFKDLFGALYSLGWTKAEAYHPISTMSELMVDIAKSIPASMDFDVCPGKIETPIDSLPGGERLFDPDQIDSGRSINNYVNEFKTSLT